MKSIYNPQYRAVISRLKRARLELKLTQAEVAHELGWCRSTVGKIEIAERRLDIFEASRLCELLEVSWTEVRSLLEREVGEDEV